jgi:cellulose synthase/poly-beta-1,6-N-acetylglucosamine synthase-like glycosyltransferase
LRLAKAVFWTSTGLLAYTQIGYPLALAAASAVRRRGPRPVALHQPPENAPRVALIVAAHDEQEVIARKVANALALDWPRDRLEVVVCCDGCTDETAQRARAAGADRVLEVARGGKVRAQDAGVDATTSELLAFSDANASWEPEALAELARAFADPGVGYACGQVRFTRAATDGNDAAAATPNEEGLYWRYEMWVRERESELRSVTAGNGAIYATRRQSYIRVDPAMDHDLSFPFNMVKRGWRAVYVPSARATEKMVPTIEGEFARKRRMMSHGAWPTVVRGGLADPRGYDPAYAAMIVSHRLLRYATPGLHLAALATSMRLALRPARSPVYTAALASQLAVLAAAAAAPHTTARLPNVARYYVLTTTSLALGLYDWLRHGTRVGWPATGGTR